MDVTQQCTEQSTVALTPVEIAVQETGRYTLQLPVGCHGNHDMPYLVIRNLWYGILQPAPRHMHILISPIPGGREIPFQL